MSLSAARLSRQALSPASEVSLRRAASAAPLKPPPPPCLSLASRPHRQRRALERLKTSTSDNSTVTSPPSHCHVPSESFSRPIRVMFTSHPSHFHVPSESFSRPIRVISRVTITSISVPVQVVVPVQIPVSSHPSYLSHPSRGVNRIPSRILRVSYVLRRSCGTAAPGHFGASVMLQYCMLRHMVLRRCNIACCGTWVLRRCRVTCGGQYLCIALPVVLVSFFTSCVPRTPLRSFFLYSFLAVSSLAWHLPAPSHCHFHV